MSDPQHPIEPDIWQNMRRELSHGRLWVDRAVVLSYAALAGLSVVVFTWLTDIGFAWFEGMYHAAWWTVLIWPPLCTMGIVWVTQRWFAKAAGSGIPQVMVALEPALPASQRSVFVSLKLSIAKIVLASAGVMAGLSVGREGPSVQVAAGVMLHARRWLRNDTDLGVHALLVAGGAGGIAATFNAPLAGVVFALEELGRKLPARNSGLIIAVIVLAGLVGITFFGNNHFLGTIKVPPLGLSILMPGLVVTLVCGLLGGLFARLMALALTGTGWTLNGWRKRHPLRFAGVLGLIIAILGLATNGQTFGGGAESVRDLLAQEHEPSPLFVPFKFLATWLTAWSGVPGGIFAPSLAVGAGVGYDVAQYSDNMPLMAPLVAMGMAAFLAAVTQAPLTAFIIVMEMVDGGAMVLSLMAAAMVASMVSRSISRPLYPALAGAMYAALQPQAPSTPAGEDKKPTTDPAPELAAAVAAAHQDSEPAEAETGAEAPLRTTLETAGDDPRHPASPEPPAADDQQPPADPPVKGSHSQPDLFP